MTSAVRGLCLIPVDMMEVRPGSGSTDTTPVPEVSRGRCQDGLVRWRLDFWGDRMGAIILWDMWCWLQQGGELWPDRLNALVQVLVRLDYLRVIPGCRSLPGGIRALKPTTHKPQTTTPPHPPKTGHDGRQKASTGIRCVPEGAVCAPHPPPTWLYFGPRLACFTIPPPPPPLCGPPWGQLGLFPLGIPCCARHLWARRPVTLHASLHAGRIASVECCVSLVVVAWLTYGERGLIVNS